MGRLSAAPAADLLDLRPPAALRRTSILVLDDLVDGFVRCEVVRAGRDAVQAVCTQRGRDLFGPREDIAADLIQRGWALAAEDAPPQYRALEALARSRGGRPVGAEDPQPALAVG